MLYFINTCYTFVHIIYTFVLLLYNNEKEAFNLLQIHDILENDSLSTDDKIIAIEAFLKEDLINIKEAIEILGVARITVNRHIEDGNLPLLINKGQFKVLSKNDVINFKSTIDSTKEFFKKKERN